MNTTHRWLLQPSLRFLSIVIFTAFTCTDVKSQDINGKIYNHTLSTGSWTFAGHIGKRINTIAENRILKKESWDLVYPETQEAFRLREDDALYPKKGRWAGEFWGKYVLSAIDAYRYYGSDDLKDRIRAAVDGLLSLQDENGYIGTYSHSDFLLGNNWNVWNRKYTLWGMLEAWKLLGDKRILDAAEKFMKHLMSEVGPGAVDIVQTGNFYGMASSSILQPVVMLYRATGEKQYLDYAKYIVRQWSNQTDGLPDILNKGLADLPIHTWFTDKDPYKWAKGYELMSCAEGLIELYEVTGDRKYFKAAENIHEVILKWERSPVGSVSFNDKFIGSVRMINTISEICDAVYWNRLSFALFKHSREEKYISEIERTLYNALLASFNQQGTWGLRRLRMSHQHIPSTNHFLQHHQCCVDNVPRALFQSSETVLTAADDKIYLALFNEGKGAIMLPESGREVRIKVEGDFFDSGMVSASIQLAESEQFKLLIRSPSWSGKTVVKVNNVVQENEAAGNWLTLNRAWKNGDVIDVIFDLNVRAEYFDDNSTLTDKSVITYNKAWASMGYVEGSNEEKNALYANASKLSAADALPSAPAVTFFYGPVALARDVRISEGDVFSSIPEPKNPDDIAVKQLTPPRNIWKAFEITLNNKEVLRFCDFSSAGNTWNSSSKFNTWCIIK